MSRVKNNVIHTPVRRADVCRRSGRTFRGILAVLQRASRDRGARVMLVCAGNSDYSAFLFARDIAVLVNADCDFARRVISFERYGGGNVSFVRESAIAQRDKEQPGHDAYGLRYYDPAGGFAPEGWFTWSDASGSWEPERGRGRTE